MRAKISPYQTIPSSALSLRRPHDIGTGRVREPSARPLRRPYGVTHARCNLRAVEIPDCSTMNDHRIQREAGGNASNSVDFIRSFNNRRSRSCAAKRALERTALLACLEARASGYHVCMLVRRRSRAGAARCRRATGLIGSAVSRPRNVLHHTWLRRNQPRREGVSRYTRTNSTSSASRHTPTSRSALIAFTVSPAGVRTVPSS